MTKIYVGEDSVFTLETTQIRGVDFYGRERIILSLRTMQSFLSQRN